MCFSATASFTVAAILTPVAAYSVHRASRTDTRWMAFALYPLAFAIQQAIEGFVWLAINADDRAMLAIASRGFLFFSHFFWPAWVPFSTYRLERKGWRKTLLKVLAASGALFGMSICFPAFLQADWLSVAVVNGSLDYKTTLIYEGVVDRSTLRVVYAVLVVAALLISSERLVNLFGLVIAASVLFAHYWFDYAFISVWCYLAAIMSIYVAGMLRLEARPSAGVR
jgi:hypothetical protein